MRFLNTPKIEICEFRHDEIPSYAILSHTWEEEEVTFQDIEGARGESKKGYRKIKNCCSIASASGFEYVWIDTCCIDKTSSAELSEAINSMYRWYEEAEICYAYLADVPPGTAVTDKFQESRWFTRVLFLDSDWQKIGDKSGLKHLIYRIAGIPDNFLLGDDLGYASVAQRMSWAAKRETTRIEDIAHCPTGMFGIYMPMIYGEGERAFIRLQEEILRTTNDYSLFAWRSTEDNSGIFATSPAAFDISGSIIQTSPFSNMSSPPTVTSRGIRLSLQFKDSGQLGSGLAILDCTEIGQENKRFAIHLKDLFLTKQDFIREKSLILELLDLKDIKYPLIDMYIRQWRPKRNKRGEAVSKQTLEWFRLLLFQDNTNTKTTLSYAAKRGYDAVVKLLLDTQKIDVDVKDENGATALLLLKKAANPYSKDSYGHTPLFYAEENKYSGELESIYKIYLQTPFAVGARNGDLKAKDEFGQTRLALAAKNGHDAVTSSCNGKTPLSWAAENGHKKVIKLLLERRAEVEAAENGHEEVVRLLLERGANVEGKGWSHDTPLRRAARNNHKAVVGILLEKGAKHKAGSRFNPSSRSEQKAISEVLKSMKWYSR
ncbi:ankyrin repeat-containing protein [Xylaria digitata]|nr:ankyrin repeat-containing protein [Xylaria digitata]